jgi:hypothetical protein
MSPNQKPLTNDANGSSKNRLQELKEETIMILNLFKSKE